MKRSILAAVILAATACGGSANETPCTGTVYYMRQARADGQGVERLYYDAQGATLATCALDGTGCADPSGAPMAADAFEGCEQVNTTPVAR